MKTLPQILAIDTSCDDTSAAVTRGTVVLSNVVASQVELHKQYGGVFPTVAKLAHKENITATISLALKQAGVHLDDIQALAVTYGPGLAPALEVGIAHAKTIAEQSSLPLIPVNHVEGHLLSVLATPRARGSAPSVGVEPKFPALALIVSGGHTQFVLVKAINDYEILGKTLDDAAGECLDKIGRMVNLGYPAGALIEKFAKFGNKKAITFPLPLTHLKTYDLSFSGLKTFARNWVEKRSKTPMTQQEIFDFCASIQFGVFRHICYKLEKILATYEINELWLGGGVAANINLRKMMRETSKKYGITTLRVPYTKKLCNDNAAMIGVTAGLTGKIQKINEIERKPQLSLVNNLS